MSNIFEFIKKYQIYIIISIVLLLYFPVFSFNLLYFDDIPFIINNQYLNGSLPINIVDFFIPNFVRTDIYIPFTFIIYRSIIKLFGDTSFVFHFVSVFFYLLSCLALLFLLKKIIKNDLISFLATILYVIHPCHVESVVWVAALGYNIASFFFFLSFLCFFIAFDENKKLNYVYSVIFYILSILSQPIAVTLPVILLLWVYFFRKERLKESIKYLIPNFLVSIIYVYVSHNVMSSSVRFSDVSYSFLEKMQILGRYLANSFLPFQPMPIYSLPSALFLISLLLFFVVFVLIKKENKVYFWILWFLITILPYSSIFYNIEIAITDRYLMMPSVASCVAISYFLVFLFEKLKRSNLFKYFIPSIVFIFYLFVSILYIPVWKNDESLWTYAYNLNSDSILVLDGYLNQVLLKNANYQDSLILANKMIKKSPKLWVGYNNKINSLMRLGNYKEALDVCLLYNSIDSTNYESYFYMFDIYLFVMNDYENAEKSINTAENLYKKYNYYKFDETKKIRDKKIMLAYCKIEPIKIIEELKKVSDNDINKLLNDISNIDLKYDEKEKLCLQYLKNSSSKCDEYNNYIIMFLSCLYMENRYGNKSFDEMKKMSKDMVLGNSMIQSNKLDEAEKIYVSIIDRNKYIFNSYLTLGYIYLRTNKSEKALNILNRALEINPYDEKVKDMFKYVNKN